MNKININEEFLQYFKCRKPGHLEKLIEYIC